MLKNILTGVAIGIANIIPGVSGGTIIVLFGLFDKIIFAISDILKRKTLSRKENLLFLGQILFGILIGLITFANIIDYFFINWPTQTIYTFIGLILFSIPSIIKKEMPNKKVSYPFFIIGALIIIGLSIMSPDQTNIIITNFPLITLPFLFKLTIIGMIGGIAVILPGVSGAMILLILGQYHLYKSYIANVASFKLNIIIPILFIGSGILLGIILSSKIIKWALTNYRKETISFILGLIIMSSIVLIPLKITYTLPLIISSLFTFTLGALIVTLIEKKA
ncbi:MAG: DUF368 domain-containing protein [Bacilli bacterium]|jgi:putative membrane protein